MFPLFPRLASLPDGGLVNEKIIRSRFRRWTQDRPGMNWRAGRAGRGLQGQRCMVWAGEGPSNSAARDGPEYVLPSRHARRIFGVREIKPPGGKGGCCHEIAAQTFDPPPCCQRGQTSRPALLTEARP
jgi:hypothetical protein